MTGTLNITPMMRQYSAQKSRHPDAILLFRMGDFYEMFFDDAEKASKILNIALTTRDKNRQEKTPMCGFPHHAASSYISKLLAAGQRVAVCDQIENPKEAKGIVKREVTKVITPGLTDDAGIINPTENHFITCLATKNQEIGIASFDLSTGDLKITSTSEASLAFQELQRIDPKEVLISPNFQTHPKFVTMLQQGHYFKDLDDWMFESRTASDFLKHHFGVQNLAGFGLDDFSCSTIALGALLNYVKQNRIETPIHVKPPFFYNLSEFMVLDNSTLKNLEIFRNLKDGAASGSLISVLDRTRTAMGSRLLKNWVSYPMMDVEEIKKRNLAVRELVDQSSLRTDLRESLKEIFDIERIVGKIALKSATPRDLVQLANSTAKLPRLIELLNYQENPYLSELAQTDDLSYVTHAIREVLNEAPPVNFKDGGVIRSGFNNELDELKEIGKSGKQWIAQIEARERKATGINNLRVSYNRVFGYYIEVTKANQQKVPPSYVRKQTLVNSERYITEELKNYELKVLSAQDKILELEEKIFEQLRNNIIQVIGRIQQTSQNVATVDVLASLAEVAANRNYSLPDIHNGDEIRIVEGRHPVVETFDNRENYVPNDTFLDHSSHQILIITGPNMAGKSTYMRQTALIVLMAQMGSFVPASEASIGIVDRIFTRIGAADYLAFGQSTFLVEMSETAEMLNNSTGRSLALLDEVGRGTSTFDGLSIAWAVTEYIHDRADRKGPRTMFATHYHELVDVALVKERVRNYHFQVKEWNDKIVFLRKIAQGGANRSYGIQVAKLAGIPEEVINRAAEILQNLERDEIDNLGSPKISKSKKTKKKKVSNAAQLEMFSSSSNELTRELQGINIEAITPLEALNLLSDWKKKYSREDND
ncbi:MAG: DNA mismatch repair protein MutS [Desulfomonilaceae bacterium]